jgi:hypothetical protein
LSNSGRISIKNLVKLQKLEAFEEKKRRENAESEERKMKEVKEKWVKERWNDRKEQIKKEDERKLLLASKKVRNIYICV